MCLVLFFKAPHPMVVLIIKNITSLTGLQIFWCKSNSKSYFGMGRGLGAESMKDFKHGARGMGLLLTDRCHAMLCAPCTML